MKRWGFVKCSGENIPFSGRLWVRLPELGLISGVIVASILFKNAETLPLVSRIPCFFHAVSGYWCPGCGLTRAFIAFGHGRWEEAWIYHPFVFALFPMGLWRLSQLMSGLLTGYYFSLGFPLWGWLIFPGLAVAFGFLRLILDLTGFSIHP